MLVQILTGWSLKIYLYLNRPLLKPTLIWYRFLLGAEEMRIKKLYRDEALRDFLVDDLKNFKNSGKHYSKFEYHNSFILIYWYIIDDEFEFLSQSERLKIIEYELNNLKHDLSEFMVGKTIIYGYDGISKIELLNKHYSFLHV